jgi:hypothetical protein
LVLAVMAALLVLMRAARDQTPYSALLLPLAVAVAVAMAMEITAVLAAALEATILLPLAAQEIHHL